MFSSWGRHAGKILQGPREGVIQDTYTQYFLEVVRQLRHQQIGKKSGTIRLDVILSLILKGTETLELQSHFTKSPREIQKYRRHSWRSKKGSSVRDFVLFWQGLEKISSVASYVRLILGSEILCFFDRVSSETSSASSKTICIILCDFSDSEIRWDVVAVFGSVVHRTF